MYNYSQAKGAFYGRTDGWEGYNDLVKRGYTHKPSHKNSEGRDATPIGSSCSCALKKIVTWYSHQGATARITYSIILMSLRFD
ncbi:MAG: hypothetical protein KBD36_02150 [Alphaproteobacteria bacterium]|nr:hypothetical protein [Alphaproteobacteria bacterium]